MQLAERPFSPMLVRTVKPVEYSSNPDDGHLASIHSLLATRRGSSTENEREERELDICRAALDELRRVAALPYSPCGTLNMMAPAYIWPGSVSRE